MNLILNGEADATEPYWTVDAYHDGTPRPHAFIYSCTTLGYDSTFLVADTQLQGEMKREEELALEVSNLETELKSKKAELEELTANATASAAKVEELKKEMEALRLQTGTVAQSAAVALA